MIDAKIIVLQHKAVQFDDQVVYLAGHAYINCVFKQCTIVLRDGDGVLIDCTFSNCIWHIDCVVHDQSQVNYLLEMLKNT